MNIVIISEYASRELYVIEQILKKYPSTVIVKPSYDNAPASSTAPVQKKKRLNSFINKITWKLHRELWNRRFYPKKNYPQILNKIYVPASELTSTPGIDAIQELSPDVLITCRAPLLKTDIINIPSTAAVNIHYGIAPYYRGNDTLFWPLYYEDFEHLGGSIHYLTEGIDTGNVVAEVYPELQPMDGEISVDCKTTRLLATAVLQFLETIEKGNSDIKGIPQKEKGQNFNSKDRTINKSLQYLGKRVLGLARPPKRQEKIVTYF